MVEEEDRLRFVACQTSVGVYAQSDQGKPMMSVALAPCGGKGDLLSWRASCGIVARALPVQVMSCRLPHLVLYVSCTLVSLVASLLKSRKCQQELSSALVQSRACAANHLASSTSDVHRPTACRSMLGKAMASAHQAIMRSLVHQCLHCLAGGLALGTDVSLIA